MPTMYKKGSEAIVVHPSQVHNAEARGWSLKEKATKTKTLKDIQFWKGKRAQVGKKIPKGFNKNLKFIS